MSRCNHDNVIKPLLAAALCLAAATHLYSEEKAGSVMTALSSTTISGFVDTSAQRNPAAGSPTARSLVGVIATTPIAREGVPGSTATFVIYRNGSTNESLTVP